MTLMTSSLSRDYCTSTAHTSTPVNLVSLLPGKKYPLQNFISYHHFTQTHKSFLSAITSGVEPNKRQLNYLNGSRQWRMRYRIFRKATHGRLLICW